MAWLALTVKLDAAAAEVLSEALLEAGAHSVAIDTPCASRHTLTALIAADADPAAMLGRASKQTRLGRVPAFNVARIDDQDWVRRSQAQVDPVTVGKRLWIGPSWHEPPRDAAVVRIDPGLAFGTGSHPTTRLALQFLDQHVVGGERVLDYGCGSGILAIAAAKLGAARVDAVDLDAHALEASAANARINRVAVRALAPEALAPAVYDLVVSNILFLPLIVLAPLLAARTSRGGKIALAGILEAQARELAATYACWFEIDTVALLDGWALLAGVRR
jgi:ribosomal protein L11 methyltransferase